MHGMVTSVCGKGQGLCMLMHTHRVSGESVPDTVASSLQGEHRNSWETGRKKM